MTEQTRTLKNTIMGIREYFPKYIFLTECSSTAGGYVIKEALRSGYPSQSLPKFYRIDPRQVISLLGHSQRVIRGEEILTEEYENRRRELEEFFKIRIDDNNARILVYDSDWCSGKSPGSVLALLRNPEIFGFSQSIRCKNVKMNLSWALEKRIDYCPTENNGLVLDVCESDVIEIPPTPTIYTEVTRKEKHGTDLNNYNFRGRVNKGGLRYIRELKSHGKTVGEEIFRELERGKEK